MKIENHALRLKESLEVLQENLKEELEGRQSTIAFSISTASAHLLEIYLHKLKLIDTSFTLKHEWFKSKHKIDEKLSFDFPKKEEILSLMREIEEKRNDFCYGTPKKEEAIVKYVEKFKLLRDMFKTVGVENEE